MEEKQTHRYRGKRITPRKEKRGFWSEYGYLLTTVIVVVILFRVILQLAWVPSGSMETTIPTKSLLVSWRLPYLVSDPELERGDVITFWNEEMEKLLVKRVVALPGEEISFDGGFVYVDGQRLNEPYLREQGITVSADRKSFTVPEGCVFMMGDNRGGSDDSRYWDEPYVPLSQVRAKVLAVISVHKENSWRGIRMMGG